MYIAKNPFRNGLIYLNSKDQLYVEAWEEEIIFDLDNESNLSSDLIHDVNKNVFPFLAMT